MILVDEFIKLNVGTSFLEMFLGIAKNLKVLLNDF